MNISKEAQEVIESVMKLESKDSLLIYLQGEEQTKQLKIELTTASESCKPEIIDGIQVIMDDDTKNALAQIRLIVDDGAISMERIGGCAGCCACQQSK